MRHRGTRTSALVATAVAVCTVLSGCAGAGDQQGTIVLRLGWWGNADRAEVTEQAVDLFEKRNPDIEVQTSFSGYESYKQKLATQAAGRDAPDVMQLDYRQISQYADSGMLLNLGERPGIRTGDIEPTLLRTGRVHGTQYAVPWARSTQVIAYDSALWRRSGVPEPRFGWTWQDWAQTMRELAEATGRPGSTDPCGTEDVFEIWLRGHGKQLYADDGRTGFAARDLARFWRFCDALRADGALSPARETTQLNGSTETSPLYKQKTVAEFNWDAASSGYSDTLGDRLKIVPMPIGPGGRPGQYFKPSMLAGVSAHSAHPEESVRLLDFLVNDPAAGKILGVSRGIPANTKIRHAVEPTLDGFDRQIAELHDGLEGRLAPPPEAPPKGDNTLQTTFQRDYDHVAFRLASPYQVASDFLVEAETELTQ